MRVVAPAAVKFAGLKVMLATPTESVNAVPLAGFMVAKAASVLNVTTELATAAPLASVRVAFAVAGAAVEIEVVAPEALVRASFSVGAAAGTPDTPVVPTDPGLPGPQPVSKANVTASKNDNKNFENFWMKNEFCTQVP